MPLEDPRSGPPPPSTHASGHPTAAPARPADRDLEAELLDLVARTREQASEDPFRNPVLAVTLAFSLGGAKVLQPRLTNIRRIAVVTTYGSPRWLLWLVGWPDWRMFRFGIRPLCAPRCRLDWIALTGMDGATQPMRARFIERVRRRLSAF